MAELVPKQTIEELRARCDVVEIIGAYIELKRAGSVFKALCPFHKEKTPSFNVNPNRQIFHCFGCGAGGDVFRFVMDYESVDFPTALKLLAERVNFRLEFERGPARERKGPPKDLLLKTLDQAASLYQRVLREHAHAAAARDYLQRRQLDSAAIDTFRLGYAPGIRNSMQKWGKQAGIGNDLLEASGLIAKTEAGDSYNRFRDRLMFPITDPMGRTIGFSGRVLDDSIKAAKYVNSPETPLFHKSRVFYALDKARQGIIDTRTAIICEGQIDAIRCHLAGFNNVVASQGTALTENHASLVKRFGDSVLLLLDADPAGQNAAIRSTEAFISAGLDVRIVSLPPGEDPDSLILNQGRDALTLLLNQARSVVDFQIGLLTASGETATEAGNQKAIRMVMETVSRYPSSVQRDRLTRELAKRFTINLDHLLEADMQRMHQRNAPASRATNTPPPTELPIHPPLETALIELMIEFDDVASLVHEFLPLDDFQDPDCRRIAGEIVHHGHDLGWDLMQSLHGASEECLRLAAAIQMAPPKLVGDEVSPIGAARDMVLTLRRKAMERRRQEARRETENATGSEHDRLVMECQQLSIDINRLKQGWDHALPVLELG